MGSWKLSFCPFCFFSQFCEGRFVASRILPSFFLENFEEMVHDALVKVLAAEVCVAASGQNFENSLVDGEQGNVERAPAKVENDHVLFLCSLKTKQSWNSVNSQRQTINRNKNELKTKNFRFSIYAKMT